jgi:hypothetical protein
MAPLAPDQDLEPTDKDLEQSRKSGQTKFLIPLYETLSSTLLGLFFNIFGPLFNNFVTTLQQFRNGHPRRVKEPLCFSLFSMQEISPTTSIWLNDYLLTRKSRLRERAEEFRALDWLSLDQIEPFESGFVFRLNGSDRFRTWLKDRSDIQEHFLLKSVELDPRYADRLIFTGDVVSTPAGALAAIVPWDEIQPAAEYLRIKSRQSTSRSPYGSVVLPSYIEALTGALKIPQRALNSTEIPACCRTKWGAWFRIDSGGVGRALAYLAINPPTDLVPVKVALGANCFAVAALSPLAPTEPLQVALCTNWDWDLALKDLRAGSNPHPNKRKYPHESECDRLPASFCNHPQTWETPSDRLVVP